MLGAHMIIYWPKCYMQLKGYVSSGQDWLEHYMPGVFDTYENTLEGAKILTEVREEDGMGDFIRAKLFPVIDSSCNSMIEGLIYLLLTLLYLFLRTKNLLVQMGCGFHSP